MWCPPQARKRWFPRHWWRWWSSRVERVPKTSVLSPSKCVPPTKALALRPWPIISPPLSLHLPLPSPSCLPHKGPGCGQLSDAQGGHQPPRCYCPHRGDYKVQEQREDPAQGLRCHCKHCHHGGHWGVSRARSRGCGVALPQQPRGLFPSLPTPPPHPTHPPTPCPPGLLSLPWLWCSRTPPSPPWSSRP